MIVTIGNGNRIEWSPIRSVIIRVITPPDLFITSMNTDRIVLLPINHKNYNLREKKSQVMTERKKARKEGMKERRKKDGFPYFLVPSSFRNER